MTPFSIHFLVNYHSASRTCGRTTRMALGWSLSSVRTLGLSSPQFSPFVGEAPTAMEVIMEVGTVGTGTAGMGTAGTGTVDNESLSSVTFVQIFFSSEGVIACMLNEHDQT